MRDRVIVIRRRTALDELLLRHHSRGQLAFYLERRGESIAALEAAHVAEEAAVAAVLAAIPSQIPHEMVPRELLPTYLFREHDLVIVVGRDGLVANAAKYLPQQPILGVNADAAQYDGILVRFAPPDVRRALRAALADDVPTDTLTLAEATTSDGQKLLAVNEVFVGRRDHVSARYTICVGDAREPQSSSGVLIATGVGCSGWMRSVMTGALAVAAPAAVSHAPLQPLRWPLRWDARALRFAVREPFPSRATDTGIVYGDIAQDDAITITSAMPDGGVIFADGVAEDAIAFTAGMSVVVQVSNHTAALLRP